MLRLHLLVFFLHSLTKATDNHTPEIKIPSSSVSLKPSLLHVLLQLHFVVVADRFLLLQQVAQQKSATKVYVCHQGSATDISLVTGIFCVALIYSLTVGLFYTEPVFVIM